MSAISAPKCRLCQKEHWPRDGCSGNLQQRIYEREGRRVLKGSTGRASPAKPTRTASTERTDPLKQPARAPADRAIGEKPAGGTAKPRRTKRRKKK